MTKAVVLTKKDKSMKNITVHKLIDQPLGDRQVRVKMVTSRINPVDLQLLKGMPFIRYQYPQIGGIDGAGEIIEMGKGVKGYQIGEQVYFYRQFTDMGSWSEHSVVRVEDIGRIPKSLSVENAGSLVLPALTAFDALTKLQAKAGQSILIHGGGGGVGYQAVQFAIHMGLVVYCTAGAKDKQTLISMGVSRVIDYKNESFVEELNQQEIDYIFDTVGKDVLSKSIGLRPSRVISVHYPDVEAMSKLGIHLPGVIKWLLRLSGAKYAKFARKSGVDLMGQVTSPNGKQLTLLAEFIDNMDFRVRQSSKITLSEIEKYGLTASDVGKVITFV